MDRLTFTVACAVGALACLAAGTASGDVDLNGARRLDCFPQPDDGAIRPLPNVRAPFEMAGHARVQPEILTWNYKSWAFAPKTDYYTWGEFRAGDRSVLLQGEDRRLIRSAGTGAGARATVGFGKIGIYSGKGAAQSPGKDLLASIRLLGPGERMADDFFSRTNDVLTVDRATGRIAWRRTRKGRTFGYEGRAEGPGVVVIDYDAALTAVVNADRAREYGVAITDAKPVDGRCGRITIDLGESATMRSAPPPLTTGMDFWSEDAYHVPVKPGRNLMMNPGFEQGLKGWADTHGNHQVSMGLLLEKNGGRPLVAVTNEAHGGRHALWFKSYGTFRDEQIWSAPLPVVAGRTYTLSWWAKGDRRAQIAVQLQEPSGNNRLGFKYDKVPCATVCKDPLRPDRWVRRALSFVPTGCGVTVVLRAWNECEFLIDDFQLEEGDVATDPDDDPVVAKLRTDDRYNFIRFGDPMQARVELSGRPALTGQVRVRVRDFYSETLFDRTLPFSLDAAGAGALTPGFDAALAGLKGVFFVRYDFAAAGKAWTDYERFQICDPVGVAHPTAKFFNTARHFFDKTSLAPVLTQRLKDLGWGSTTWMQQKAFNEGLTGEMWKTNGIAPYLHAVHTELPRFDPGHFGWGKENFNNYTNNDPVKVAFIRDIAYKCGRECRADDTWWALFNEEEHSQKAVKKKDYDTWAVYQKAAYDGLKKAFDERGLKLHYAPTHGTVGGDENGGLATLRGYVKAGRKLGLEYDFLSIHQAWALDGASIGSWSDREKNHDDLERLLAEVGRPDMPYMQPETFYLLQMRLPSWGAIDWCDAYSGTIPSFDLGNHEFLHAGLLARAFVMDLRRWPRLMLSNPWMARPVLDREMAPSVWPVVANTLGRLLPDPRFVGTARPLAGVRGYVFRPASDRTDGVMAVWVVDHDIERGAKRGPVVAMDLPPDAKAVDLMGNPRTFERDRITLTCVPVFFTSSDPDGLLAALRNAHSKTLRKSDGKRVWEKPQTEVAVSHCAAGGPDWSRIQSVPGFPQMKAAWSDRALYLRFESDAADTLRLAFDGIADARKVKVSGWGPDDSVYDFLGATVRRVKAVNTQFADGTTTAADDNEVRRDFKRTFVKKGRGGVWEFAITPRFLTPTELAPGSRCGFAFAFATSPLEPDVGDPTEWLILDFK